MNSTDQLPIKPLEWEKQDDSYVAETWFGEVTVDDFEEFGWMSSLPPLAEGLSDDNESYFGTAEEAMADVEKDLRERLAPFLII